MFFMFYTIWALPWSKIDWKNDRKTNKYLEKKCAKSVYLSWAPDWCRIFFMFCTICSNSGSIPPWTNVEFCGSIPNWPEICKVFAWFFTKIALKEFLMQLRNANYGFFFYLAIRTPRFWCIFRENFNFFHLDLMMFTMKLSFMNVSRNLEILKRTLCKLCDLISTFCQSLSMQVFQMREFFVMKISRFFF